MKFTQENDASIIKIDAPLTGKVLVELSDLFSYIGGHDPHLIILDMQLMPYATSAGLKILFQQYSPLYEKKFSLEIQQANADVVEILRLANFHLISKINTKNTKEKISTTSLS